MAYIIAATRRNLTDTGLFLCGATVYVSKSGCLTYSGDKAYRYKTQADAEKDREYFATDSRYSYVVERLTRRDTRFAQPV